MIKKASGFILFYLLRSTLCIPLSQFYPFGTSVVGVANQRLGDGNTGTSGQLNPGLFYFYGQPEVAVTVSCFSYNHLYLVITC